MKKENINKVPEWMQMLVPDVDGKRKEIERIAHILFHQFVTDVDMLTVALYAGHIDEAVYCMQLTPGSVPQMAAEKAKAFHFDMDMIQEAAWRGYFEKNIRKLLELGRSNNDYGAKLVQVFYCFLEHAREHRLSKSIIRQMKEFIQDQGSRDGFIIKKQANGEIHETFFA